MKSLFTLLVSIGAMLFTGCDVDDLPLNNQRTYTLTEELSAIVVSDGVDVVVDSSLPHDQVVAMTNAKGFNHLNIDVSRGVLRIDIRGIVLGPTRNVIRVPSFDYERIDVNGGSDFAWYSCGSDVLSVSASGGSDCEISGATKRLYIEASGGSDIDCGGLSAEDVTIDASGGSDVEACASSTLSLTASGGSDIHITGNPQMKKCDLSGGSDVDFN
ncbi:MAG: DUF2807 domain-containing protein [Tidjanibacter sp.]|nr:DUF2807 domain-containing protein [Tidjanibacter sp.]